MINDYKGGPESIWLTAHPLTPSSLLGQLTMADKSPTSVHCNKCGATTNHLVEHGFKRDWNSVIDEEEHISIGGWDRWETLRCLGCDTIHLRHSSYFSEDMGDRGEPVVRQKFAPPRLTRAKPSWRTQLFPFDVKAYDLVLLLDEIYEALAMGACRLAAMGIRALVEQIMIAQVKDKGTFKQNIKAFFDAGYIAPRQQDTFENTLVEAGHAAMHRGFDPSQETIETLLDIIEPLIDDIYFKPHRTQKAGKAIPARK